MSHINVVGGYGSLVVTLKVEIDRPGEVTLHADVQKKFKKIKNRLGLQQDDSGKLYIDDPDQLCLPEVLPVGTSENFIEKVENEVEEEIKNLGKNKKK